MQHDLFTTAHKLNHRTQVQKTINVLAFKLDGINCAGGDLDGAHMDAPNWVPTGGTEAWTMGDDLIISGFHREG